jgi:hypothetical protein
MIMCLSFKLKLVILVTCNISSTAGEWGLISRRSRFSTLHIPHTGSGTLPLSCPVSSRGSFTGSKVAGHNTGHSPTSGAENETV